MSLVTTYRPQCKLDSISVISVTGNEPFELEEVKQFLRTSGCESFWADHELKLLFSAVREQAEKYTGIGLIVAQREAVYTKLEKVTELSYGIIDTEQPITVTRQVAGESDEELTLGTDYDLLGSGFVKLSPKWGVRIHNIPKTEQIVVQYTSGYAATKLDSSIRLALLKSLATEYRFRENVSEKRLYELSTSTKNLLAPYRRDWVAQTGGL